MKKYENEIHFIKYKIYKIEKNITEKAFTDFTKNKMKNQKILYENILELLEQNNKE